MFLSTYYKIKKKSLISTAGLNFKTYAPLWHFYPKRAIEAYINTVVIKYFPFAENQKC